MATVMTDRPVSEATRRFLDRAGRLWIDGQWQAACLGETFEVYNPATGEILAHCAAGDKAEPAAGARASGATSSNRPFSPARNKP
jgi:phenylacetaldehyde dehydrogenase